jgi:DNA-directed RNA polymerase
MDTNVLPNDPQVLHPELDIASEKLEKRNERAFANAGFGATTGGMSITTTYIDRLVPCVIAQLSAGARSDSKKHHLEHVIRQLDPEVIALVILQGALHSVGHEETLRDTYLRIGRMLSNECWAAKLTKTDKQLAQRISRFVKLHHGSVEKRQDAARVLAARPQVGRDKKTGKKVAKSPGFKMRYWSHPEMIHAGHWCTQVLLDALPDVFALADGRNGEYELTLTPEGLHKAEAAVAEAVVRNPAYQPRADRPKDWDGVNQRVAEDDRTAHEAPLLRTWHKDIISAARHAIKTGTMAPTLTAVNALQSVPFRINTWIMDIIQECHDRHIDVEGLPAARDVALPRELTNEEYEALDADARAVRRDEIKGVKKVNRSLNGERVLFASDMATAQRMALLDQFYVPMNMDWRGRVYGLAHFNFQREDRVRSMFLFAKGEAIGEEGLYWLKIHVANCGDFDKVSKKPMDTRIAWVNENLELLTDYVKRPMFNTGWTKADSPFLFLAACRELVSALNEGSTYVTHIPVSFDGSCSGLQHLAAMTRAPEGRYVNLTDNEVPEDVYTLVADRARARIEQDLDLSVEEGTSKEIETADHDRRMAKMCLDYGITRNLVKRNTMTYSYSSKVFGMSQQHLEDTMRPLKTKVLKHELEVHPFGEDEGYAASKYLAKHIHAAIEELVSLPAEAMRFLQGCARALAHEGKPLRWTSPAGIPWINRYHEPVTERIELWLNDHGVKSRTRVTVATGFQAPISKEKASSGVAPNFVHANDASHLLLTVAASAAEGITDIATVHDSFGCLPSRAGRFNQIIREQFLKMYEDHDVLAELLACAKSDLTEANHSKLPELPARGTLDLKEILNAKYAFA